VRAGVVEAEDGVVGQAGHGGRVKVVDVVLHVLEHGSGVHGEADDDDKEVKKKKTESCA
jgi:hypothetical protein